MGNRITTTEKEEVDFEVKIEKTDSKDTSSETSGSTEESRPSVEKRASVVRFAEPYITSVRGVADYRDLYNETSLPDVFQIIRMGHEVIRGNLIDIEGYIAMTELDKAMDSYERLCRWSRMYMKMHVGNGSEDESDPASTVRGLFVVLDENFANITKEHHMREDLKNLAIKGEKVGSALKNQSDNLKSQFLELKRMIHDHLGRKEAILMPKIRKMKADDKLNLKQIMKDDMLSLVADSPDFKFFIQHANHHLDKHGQNKPKARMFDHALWYCATGSQWKDWQRWIKGSVRKKTFDEIVAAISF